MTPSRDANCLIRSKIDKRRGHFSPVAKFQGTFTEAASGHHTDRIRSATIDLDISHKPLAVFSARIINAEPRAAEHRQAHSEDLSGAKMPMCDFGLPQQLVKSIHTCMVVPTSNSPLARSLSALRKDTYAET